MLSMLILGMGFFLRGCRLVSMAVWVGGIVFFAFVVAPVAFHSLPSAREAGIVVRGTIVGLHWIGLACGLVFLGATGVLWMRGRRAGLGLEMALVASMVGVTVGSQVGVLPAMERDRVSGGGAIEGLGVEDARRVDFERLHVLSERMEGAVLLLGLATVVLMGREG